MAGATLRADLPRERTRSGTRRSAKDDHRQATEAGLDLLRVLGWMVIHDVSVTGSPEIVVDHVAAGPSGVYVINTVVTNGPVVIGEDSVLCGGVGQRAELRAVAEAAEKIRALAGGRPVAPLLCFASGEEFAGLVGGVAVCSTENILDVLTAQAARLDSVTQGAVARALRDGLLASLSPRVAPEEDEPVAVAPKRHRQGLRFKKGSRVEDEPVAGTAFVEPAETPTPVTPALEAVAPLAEPAVAPAVEETPVLEAGPRHVAPPAPTRVAAAEPAVAPKRRAAAPSAASVRGVAAEAVTEAPSVEPVETSVAEAATEAQPEAPSVEPVEPVETSVAEAVTEAQPVVEPSSETPAPSADAAVSAEVAGQRADLAVERSQLADERAALVAERERTRAELRDATERRRKAALEEQRSIAEERRAAASERARAEDEHREVLAEQERIVAEQQRIAAEQQRIAADRKRVAEERRLAEEAQARAVEERKRAVAERKAAEVAQARAEQERIAADRRAADRAHRERHVEERVAADLASQGVHTADAALAASAAAGLPSRFAPPPHAFAPQRAETAEKATPSHRSFGVGGVKVVAIAAILVALVAGVAPRMPALIDWGKALVGATTPSAAFGGPISLGANTYHPDIQVVAGAPTTARVSGGVVPRGSTAISVPLRITNQGSSRWVLPLGAQLVAVDSLGMEHQLVRGITALKGGNAFGANIRIPGGKIAAGSAVFAVPTGRTITEVRLELSTDKHDQPVWKK